MNEAIVTKALENLRARVAELEAERDDARAEAERLRAEVSDEKRRNHYVRAGNAERENARLRAELAETTHVLAVTGEKVEALRGQRDRAEAERDRLAEQVTGMVRILNGLLQHADLTDDVRTEIQNALDGTEDGR